MKGIMSQIKKKKTNWVGLTVHQATKEKIIELEDIAVETIPGYLR